MFRFSLSTLLVGVLVVGLGCAALSNPTPLIEKVFSNLTLAVLGLAALAGLYLPRSTRAFYGGFAVAGWMYFAIVTLNLSTETDLLSSLSGSVKDHLVTTDCLRFLDTILAKPDPEPDVPKQIKIGITRTGEDIYARNFEYYDPAVQLAHDRAAFYNIGQLLFVMLFGAIGGILARAWQSAAGKDVESKSNGPRG